MNRSVTGRLRRAISAFAEVRGAALIGAVALILLFAIWLGAEVGEGETHALDTRILLALRRTGDLAQPIGPHWLQVAMLDLTSLGSGAVLSLVTIVAIGLFVVQRKYAQSVFVAVAIGSGAMLNFLLKIGYARPRPELVAHLAAASLPSFPSGHAMNSAVTYLVLSVLLARITPELRVKAYIAWTGMLLPLIVGISRIYLGVHWPTDVLAGWAVGAAWAGLCWFVAERIYGPPSPVALGRRL